MTTHFWAVPKIGTPAIQIDIDPEALGRNYPPRWRQRRRQGDAGRMLAAADRAGAGKGKAGSRRRRRSARNGRRSTSPRSTSDAVPIRPERICGELTLHVPDNGIVVVDTGHGGMWMGVFMISPVRRKATCAAPAISAGRSWLGSAPMCVP